MPRKRQGKKEEPSNSASKQSKPEIVGIRPKQAESPPQAAESSPQAEQPSPQAREPSNSASKPSKPEILGIRPKKAESPPQAASSKPQAVESKPQAASSKPQTPEFTPPKADAQRKALTADDFALRSEIRLWWKKELPEFSAGLTMSELAKRWGVASYKIGQRRTTPKFQKWSHRCDPDGIIWEYRPAAQYNIPQFFPVGQAPKEEPKSSERPNLNKPGQPLAGRHRPGQPNKLGQPNKPGQPRPERPKRVGQSTSTRAE